MKRAGAVQLFCEVMRSEAPRNNLYKKYKPPRRHDYQIVDVLFGVSFDAFSWLFQHLEGF